MTFDDVRKLVLVWPEVEDGTSYGTAALKVRKKLLARLKEDGDTWSCPAWPTSATCWWRASRTVFYFTDHYRRLSDGAGAAVKGEARQRRTVAAAALAGAGVEGGAGGGQAE